MKAIRLPNGNLLVPRRAEAADGTVGDRMVEVASESEDGRLWAAFTEEAERSEPSAPEDEG